MAAFNRSPGGWGSPGLGLGRPGGWGASASAEGVVLLDDDESSSPLLLSSADDDEGAMDAGGGVELDLLTALIH